MFVAGDGFKFAESALPLLVAERRRASAEETEVGEVLRLRKSNEAVFLSDEEALQYMMDIAGRDLQYRGFREDRLKTFELQALAQFQLQARVKRCKDEEEYKMLTQKWEEAH